MEASFEPAQRDGGSLADVRRALERLDFGPAVLPVPSQSLDAVEEASAFAIAVNAEPWTAPELQSQTSAQKESRDTLRNPNETAAVKFEDICPFREMGNS